MNRQQRRAASRAASSTGPKLAIAYLHSGKVSAAFTMSLVRLMIYEGVRTGAYPRLIALRCGTLGIVEGRNQAVQSFLDDTPCDWLFMVDSDMGFAPEIVHELEQSAPAENLIVGALCFANKRCEPDHRLQAERWDIRPTVYQWQERDDEAGFATVGDYPRGQVIEVSATGTAALLMHRSALETIRAKHGDRPFDQLNHPKAGWFSEDLSFCIRAAAAGVPIRVNTAVKTSHDKGGVFLTEELFDEQRAGRAGAAES